MQNVTVKISKPRICNTNLEEQDRIRKRNKTKRGGGIKAFFMEMSDRTSDTANAKMYGA